MRLQLSVSPVLKFTKTKITKLILGCKGLGLFICHFLTLRHSISFQGHLSVLPLWLVGLTKIKVVFCLSKLYEPSFDF